MMTVPFLFSGNFESIKPKQKLVKNLARGVSKVENWNRRREIGVWLLGECEYFSLLPLAISNWNLAFYR